MLNINADTGLSQAEQGLGPSGSTWRFERLVNACVPCMSGCWNADRSSSPWHKRPLEQRTGMLVRFTPMLEVQVCCVSLLVG